jgi:hypothetical protein
VRDGQIEFLCLQFRVGRVGQRPGIQRLSLQRLGKEIVQFLIVVIRERKTRKIPIGLRKVIINLDSLLER